MDGKFGDHCHKLPRLYAELMACPEYPMRALAEWDGLKVIYVFLDGQTPRHVGRTRNLRQRIAGHRSSSHYSASFAFSQARKALGIAVTYRKGEGRLALLERPDFKAEFDRQRTAIGRMTLKFLRVDDPIDQYLFELYAALKLNTSLDEFETS